MSIEIDGLDQLVKRLSWQATTIRPKAGAAALAAATKAAERMRDRVPIDEGDLLDSITVDPTPTITGGGAYVDVGPDRTANPGAFKAHFHERGTVKMGPTPFVGPAGDETLPEFVAAMKKLSDL